MKEAKHAEKGRAAGAAIVGFNRSRRYWAARLDSSSGHIRNDPRQSVAVQQYRPPRWAEPLRQVQACVIKILPITAVYR
jgi:hypothetical protein